MTHPVVLGSGQRLFGPDDDPHRFRLVEATASETGVVVSRYAAS